MKRIFFIQWVNFLCACLLWGCGSYQLEEEGETPEEDVSEDAVIRVALDNPEGFVSLYPLQFYLFDSSDRCVYEDGVLSEKDIPALVQPKGTYVLTAFSGLLSGEYAFPLEIHPRQMLTFSENCCAGVPLIVGKSHVLLERDMNVSMNLFYPVACLYFSFGSFSEDVSEVTLHLSPVSSGISLGGDVHDDDRFATISCLKENSCWMAGPVYVIPSDATRIHLSLKLKQNGEETVYGYDYDASLEAGKVYRFMENKEGGVDMGEISQVNGWEPGADIELDFDDFEQGEPDDWEEPSDEDDTEEDIPDGDEDDNISGGDTDILYADELPEADNVWGPFFVWKTEQLSSTSVKAMLLAPHQWLMKVDEAVAASEAYEVDGITGWRVLTVEEAKEFRDQYDETIVELSEYLFENGIDRFNKYDIRYLCDDFNSTFCFYNTRISKSGKTVDYGLRLFKEVIVEKK